jgi:hypothetical protein
MKFAFCDYVNSPESAIAAEFLGGTGRLGERVVQNLRTPSSTDEIAALIPRDLAPNALRGVLT